MPTSVCVFRCIRAAGQMQVAVSCTDLLVFSTHMVTTEAEGRTTNTSITSGTILVPGKLWGQVSKNKKQNTYINNQNYYEYFLNQFKKKKTHVVQSSTKFLLWTNTIYLNNTQPIVIIFCQMWAESLCDSYHNQTNDQQIITEPYKRTL